MEKRRAKMEYGRYEDRMREKDKPVKGGRKQKGEILGEQ